MTVDAIARDHRSAPFFDAAARGTLLIRRCDTTGRFYPPGGSACDCGVEPSWVPASGRGVLISWAIVPARHCHTVADRILGIVELAEGPWLRTSIIGARADQMVPGAPLEVVFRHAAGGEFVPLFAPPGAGIAVIEQAAPAAAINDSGLRLASAVGAAAADHSGLLRRVEETPASP